MEVSRRSRICAAAAVQIAGRLVRQNQDGSLTSARATATRCFWPPGQLGRRMSRAIHEPDAPPSNSMALS